MELGEEGGAEEDEEEEVVEGDNDDEEEKASSEAEYGTGRTMGGSEATAASVLASRVRGSLDESTRCPDAAADAAASSASSSAAACKDKWAHGPGRPLY